MMRSLEIGGVVVPLLAGITLEQTYQPVGGFTVLRMMNGAAVIQEHWSKLATTVTGYGTMPPGLAALDCLQTHTLKCIRSRSIFSVSNAIALPAARRTDYAPVGHAILSSGRQQVTPVNLVGDVATLTAVSGATGYMVLYWPQLSVVITSRPAERGDIREARVSWEFTAEEA